MQARSWVWDVLPPVHNPKPCQQPLLLRRLERAEVTACCQNHNSLKSNPLQISDQGHASGLQAKSGPSFDDEAAPHSRAML